MYIVYNWIASNCLKGMMSMSIYDFKVKRADGTEVSLEEYRGKVLLIINSATGCGFTPQYEGLQELYEAEQAKGFEILDFPCNQFGAQAPGTDEEIHTFCTGRFSVTFPQFAKCNVRGENAIPLFRYLADNTAFEGFGKSPMSLLMSGIAKKMDKDYKKNGEIKWNFTKFVIDRDGNIAGRFEPTQDVKRVAAKVRELL